MIEEDENNGNIEDDFYIYFPHEMPTELITWDEFAGNFT